MVTYMTYIPFLTVVSELLKTWLESSTFWFVTWFMFMWRIQIIKLCKRINTKLLFSLPKKETLMCKVFTNIIHCILSQNKIEIKSQVFPESYQCHYFICDEHCLKFWLPVCPRQPKQAPDNLKCSCLADNQGSTILHPKITFSQHVTINFLQLDTANNNSEYLLWYNWLHSFHFICHK